MADSNKPVMNSGEPYRERPYVAGGKAQDELAARKSALMKAGRVGHVPGHGGIGRGSSEGAGYVSEEPPQSGPHPEDPELEYTAARRPMPREVPVHAQTTHMGTIVRFLDGHSEIHRERPHLQAMLNDPDTHPDHREDIRAEIVHRDAIHNHRFW